MNATILRLTGLAACCGLLISGVYALTREHIHENRAAFEARQLLEVVGDTDASVHSLAPDVYAIEKGASRVGYVFETRTTEGYNGEITLWVAVDNTNEIIGVRVKSHQETPGLGDKIETRVSDWIHTFEGKSLSDPGPGAWRVRKDGGKFDQFTGATITPRAVVNAVREALVHARKNQADWSGMHAS